ncbi:MAG TPA: SGNH/GDSL hydrolase family protein [Acidimicrobiales bacterium]|nr:SGNH/GDSL hydrolase family protein [Acidimicrobiales bacterium]
MARHIRFIAATLAVIALVELGLRAVDSRLPPGRDWYSRFAQAKAARMHDIDEPVDVVFAGDSATMRGIDSQSFAARCGGRAFNAAIPGITPVELTTWMSEVVEPALEPATVALGFTSRSFAPHADTRGAFHSSRALRDDTVGRLDRWLAERSAIIEHRTTLSDPGELKEAIVQLVRGRKAGEWDRLDAFGYAPVGHDTTYSLGRFRHAETGILREYEVSREDVDALGRLIDALRDDGIDVVLMDMPTSSDWAGLHPRGERDVADYREALAEVAERHDVELVDLTGVVEGTEHFQDPLHLDDDGTELLTDEAAAALC